MKLYEWVDSVFGKAVDVDGVYGAQCVDLVNDYLQRVWAVARVTGNAIDIRGQAVRKFVWIPNQRENAPVPGSIVVWDNPPLGHTAVVLWASPLHLVTLDQNWAGVRVATVVSHGYHNVSGWHQPG